MTIKEVLIDSMHTLGKDTIAISGRLHNDDSLLLYWIQFWNWYCEVIDDVDVDTCFIPGTEKHRAAVQFSGDIQEMAEGLLLLKNSFTEGLDLFDSSLCLQFKNYFTDSAEIPRVILKAALMDAGISLDADWDEMLVEM